MRPFTSLFESKESAAKAFLLKKWRQRSKELGRESLPHNLSGACKGVALFTQKIFGGELQANYDHCWVVKGGRILDLTDNVDHSNYDADYEFMASAPLNSGLKSWEDRVNSWVSEFKKQP